MINLFWRLIAKLLALPAIAGWLIGRAKLTPYQHIMSADGTEMYMGRWWLFNPYSRETHKPALWWCPWSFRVHHIMRPDEDRDLHDHPWNARTIILRGWYTEERLEPASHVDMLAPAPLLWLEELDDLFKLSMRTRSPGDTAPPQPRRIPPHRPGIPRRRRHTLHHQQVAR
ncbi:hypothetical protein [Pseudomonas sp. PS01303]|uniref:hypothetical protein n=1 Tax=Pseudomonas sp. PS01303 TaxID=2991439 RepID=UPI002499EA02|nr:hypothetical protein [Pseudomonas sp. PS01303]